MRLSSRRLRDLINWSCPTYFCSFQQRPLAQILCYVTKVNGRVITRFVTDVHRLINEHRRMAVGVGSTAIVNGANFQKKFHLSAVHITLIQLNNKKIPFGSRKFDSTFLSIIVTSFTWCSYYHDVRIKQTKKFRKCWLLQHVAANYVEMFPCASRAVADADVRRPTNDPLHFTRRPTSAQDNGVLDGNCRAGNGRVSISFSSSDVIVCVCVRGQENWRKGKK